MGFLSFYHNYTTLDLLAFDSSSKVGTRHAQEVIADAIMMISASMIGKVVVAMIF